jgi:hypothetical protein
MIKGELTPSFTYYEKPTQEAYSRRRHLPARRSSLDAEYDGDGKLIDMSTLGLFDYFTPSFKMNSSTRTVSKAVKEKYKEAIVQLQLGMQFASPNSIAQSNGVSRHNPKDRTNFIKAEYASTDPYSVCGSYNFPASHPTASGDLESSCA